MLPPPGLCKSDLRFRERYRTVRCTVRERGGARSVSYKFAQRDIILLRDAVSPSAVGARQPRLRHHHRHLLKWGSRRREAARSSSRTASSAARAPRSTNPGMYMLNMYEDSAGKLYTWKEATAWSRKRKEANRPKRDRGGPQSRRSEPASAVAKKPKPTKANQGHEAAPDRPE